LIMEKDSMLYNNYIKILEYELVPATGCTEPVALAYAAAKARSVLGQIPENVEVEVSGNIIKNVKSVVVPNTGGMKGIEAAVAAGVVAGDEEAELEVVQKITREEQEKIHRYLETHTIDVIPSRRGKVFYIDIKVTKGNNTARVVIEDHHTNITHISLNGEVIINKGEGELSTHAGEGKLDYDLLNVKDIIDFANSVDIEDIRHIIGRQADYNFKISREGLNNNWGAAIGKTLILARGNDIKVRVCAAAAAGSDARMSGCELPVVIVSGSGNQGITASVPVIEYARFINASEEKLLRALVLSDLLTIHQKSSIGRLSAFCGAVSAGAAAAAGIAYLLGYGNDVIEHTIVNALGIISGMVCDGAKPSCAAKIAMAVEAGLLGFEMYVCGQKQFFNGEGIIKKGVDNTIRTVGRLARKGMQDTDYEILDIMTQKEAT